MASTKLILPNGTIYVGRVIAGKRNTQHPGAIVLEFLMDEVPKSPPLKSRVVANG